SELLALLLATTIAVITPTNMMIKPIGAVTRSAQPAPAGPQELSLPFPPQNRNTPTTPNTKGQNPKINPATNIVQPTFRFLGEPSPLGMLSGSCVTLLPQ
ncbi:MAG: hypothetical protein RIS09_904, partial [Actinomycetota bacterium]